MEENIVKTVQKTKAAFLKTMFLNEDVKNNALKKIIEKLQNNIEVILKTNNQDLEKATELLNQNKINKATFNRLKLSKEKIRDLIKGLEDLIKLNDPVNRIIWEKELDDGLILKKVSCPIGVIAIIFEARPDCFIQIASLIIKSGNCGILKGGSECIETNKLFAKLVDEALNEVNYPKNAINLIHTRDEIKDIFSLDEYIDLIIPRGGNSLVKYIKENTKIPVLGHASGICHIFVDEKSNFDNVKKVVLDAKTQYPSACNSVETLLIHKNFTHIKELEQCLKSSGIQIIKNPSSYSVEYGDKILSIKFVNDLDEAIEHINKYGSGHTDTIISEDMDSIEKFMNYTDSSSVMANCSTRFSDGFRYGFGAEVGISTNKTHARGPVGLEGLTIYKYKLYGSNSIVSDYVEGKKTFKHNF